MYFRSASRAWPNKPGDSGQNSKSPLCAESASSSFKPPFVPVWATSHLWVASGRASLLFEPPWLPKETGVVSQRDFGVEVAPSPAVGFSSLSRSTHPLSPSIPPAEWGLSLPWSAAVKIPQDNVGRALEEYAATFSYFTCHLSPFLSGIQVIWESISR